MKKLYFVLAILLTFSAASAEEKLPPIEFGTNPYTYDYTKLRQNPYQNVQPAAPIAQPVQQNLQELRRDYQPTALDESLKAKHKFALIVPLTGKNSDIGKALRDAAVLAVEEKGSVSNNVPDYAIIPLDSNGDGGVEAAAEKAVENGAEVILGPVFSDQVGKVAKIARKNKIKVISFSNNKAVAGNGVYVFGLIPNQQVERMLLFAGDKGVRNFSAIVPNNNYGQQSSEMVRKYSKWIGGNLRDIGLYSANTKLSQAASVIADAYKNQGAKPSIGKDAIIIPEGGEKLRNIVSAINTAGVGCGRIRCLGVASWDDKDIIGYSGLNGAWYAASPYEDVEDFLGRFQNKYHYVPDEISSLGYDVASLAVELAPYFTKEAIEKNSGFKGVKGAYRFIADGSNQRAYAIYEIRSGLAQVIDGAPGHF